MDKEKIDKEKIKKIKELNAEKSDMIKNETHIKK